MIAADSMPDVVQLGADAYMDRLLEACPHLQDVRCERDAENGLVLAYLEAWTRYTASWSRIYRSVAVWREEDFQGPRSEVVELVFLRLYESAELLYESMVVDLVDSAQRHGPSLADVVLESC